MICRNASLLINIYLFIYRYLFIHINLPRFPITQYVIYMCKWNKNKRKIKMVFGEVGGQGWFEGCNSFQYN